MWCTNLDRVVLSQIVHCRFKLWKPQCFLNRHFVYYYFFNSEVQTNLHIVTVVVLFAQSEPLLSTKQQLFFHGRPLCFYRSPEREKKAIYLTYEWTQIQNQNICKHVNLWAGKIYKSDW